MTPTTLVREIIEAPGRDVAAPAPGSPDARRWEDGAAVRQIIPIFFTIDDGYAPYLGIALHSLIQNASRDYDYDINILHDGLSPEHLQKLEALAEPGFDLRFYRMADKIAGIENAHHNKLRQDYFTLTIFFRLFIPAMFPEYDKGIYLDSDIVVPGDVSKMYETDLGDNLLGACRDLSILGIPEFVEYTNDVVGVGIQNYINSGVLLMNLQALREARLDDRFLELLYKYHFENLAPDQDYLNVLCHGRITYLDPCWDAMPIEGQDEMDRPQIVHYNLFSKPWCYDGIPYGNYFWYYALQTEFLDEVLDNKLNYSDQQKASDAACAAAMVEHGRELIGAGFGFSSVFNTGIEARL